MTVTNRGEDVLVMTECLQSNVVWQKGTEKRATEYKW